MGCHYTVTVRHEEPRVFKTLKAARASAVKTHGNSILRRKCGSASKIIAACKHGGCRTSSHTGLGGLGGRSKKRSKRRKSSKRR